MPQTKFLLSLAFHPIQRGIGCAQKFVDARAVLGIYGKADADGNSGLLAVTLQLLADSESGLGCFGFARLRKNQSKLIAAIPRRSINRPAAATQGCAQTLDGPASCQVPILIVDFL